jgi:hypothetical protein
VAGIRKIKVDDLAGVKEGLKSGVAFKVKVSVVHLNRIIDKCKEELIFSLIMIER